MNHYWPFPILGFYANNDTCCKPTHHSHLSFVVKLWRQPNTFWAIFIFIRVTESDALLYWIIRDVDYTLYGTLVLNSIDRATQV